MGFKALILLSCLVFAHVNAVKIKCKIGVGLSLKSHDANAEVQSEDCDEGITQCMKTGLKLGGAAGYKFGCSKKKDVQTVRCTVSGLTSTCYCTGTGCNPPNPTDKKDAANQTKKPKKIQCKVGGGPKDCEEGITQCMKTGPKDGKAAAYKFGCSKTKDVKTLGCTVSGLTSTCYCTGNLCDPCSPTDKKCKNGKNSANTIGAQVTVGFAVFLAVFNKVMA